MEIKGKGIKEDDSLMYKIILYVWTKVSQNDYFLKLLYANTKDVNSHLIKNNLQTYTFQEEKVYVYLE